MACSPDGLICSMDTPLYPGRRKAQRLIPGQAQICSALLQPLRLFILLWRPSWLSYFTNATFPKAFQTAQNFLQLGNKKVAKEFFSRASYSVGFRVKKSFFFFCHVEKREWQLVTAWPIASWNDLPSWSTERDTYFCCYWGRTKS